MKKENILSETFKKFPSVKDKNYFEGNVYLKDISKNIKQMDYKVYHVLFIKGAKTRIHSHRTSQTLLATKGKGIVVTFNKIRRIINGYLIKRDQIIYLIKGEMIIIPKDIIHLHGANADNIFSHITINGIKEPNTIWYESDSKYSNDNLSYKINKLN